MDEESNPDNPLTLLKVSLAPMIMVEVGDQGEVNSAIEVSERLIAETLANFDGLEFQLPGGIKLVRFADLEKAINCALQVERRIDEFNATQISLNRMVVGIGVHHSNDLTDEGWVGGDGLKRVSTTCTRAARTGGVFISEDARQAITNASDFRFEDVESWPVDDEDVKLSFCGHAACSGRRARIGLWGQLDSGDLDLPSSETRPLRVEPLWIPA